MNESAILIDFCICTYNRKSMLQRCLETLLEQVSDQSIVVTVIDNQSTDETAGYVHSMMAAHAQVRYILEPWPGLSLARNTGWQQSNAKWIYYLDDDSIVAPGLVATALRVVNSGPPYEAYGGPIIPGFENEPPAWFPRSFGEFSIQTRDIHYMERGYIRGCNMMFSKKSLKCIGGFHEALGPHKDSLGYGDEIDVQDRMRTAGFRVAYVPGLKIEHVMRLEKISLRWLLASEYVRRRDKAIFTTIKPLPSAIMLLRTLGTRVFYLPYFTIRSAVSPRYRFKTAMYDALKPVAYRWGEWIGAMKHKIKH